MCSLLSFIRPKKFTRRVMEPLVVILGATGTGKSKLAIELASKFKGEIISADSMQIYQGLDIVTNKVTAEEQLCVKHHMIDIVNPLESFTVVEFRDTVLPIIEHLHKERTLPIVVGGTHYYVESILWKVLVQSNGNFDKFSRKFIQENNHGDLVRTGDNKSFDSLQETNNESIIPNCGSKPNIVKTANSDEQRYTLNNSCLSEDVSSEKLIHSTCKCERPTGSSALHQSSFLNRPSDICQCRGTEQNNFNDGQFNKSPSLDVNCIKSEKFMPIHSDQSKISLSIDCVEKNKKESDASEINIQPLNYCDISNEELLRKLEDIDPEMSSRYHPNDRRKILRSLEVWHQTGIRHSEHLRKQSEEVGGADLGGRIRFKNAFILWITCEKDNLNKRLDGRVNEMIEKGLIEELSAFHTSCNFPKLLTAEGKEGSDFIKERVSDHYQRGIFQSIGLKEFHEYLLLDDSQRQSDVGKKLLQKGVETMKLRTRQYAKRQEKWMKNRFLIRNRERIPVYALDGNDLSKWDENVKTPAIEIMKCLLKGETPSQQPSVAPSDNSVVDTGNKTRHFCDVCQRIFIGDPQWEQHMKSKKHRIMVQKLTSHNDASVPSTKLCTTKRILADDDIQINKVQKL